MFVKLDNDLRPAQPRRTRRVQQKTSSAQHENGPFRKQRPTTSHTASQDLAHSIPSVHRH